MNEPGRVGYAGSQFEINVSKMSFFAFWITFWTNEPKTFSCQSLLANGNDIQGEKSWPVKMTDLIQVIIFNQWVNSCVGLSSIRWSGGFYNFDSSGMTEYLRKSAALKTSLILELLGFLFCARPLTAIKIIVGVCCILIMVLVGLFGDYLLYRDGQYLITSVNFLFENYRGLMLMEGETVLSIIPIHRSYLI